MYVEYLKFFIVIIVINQLFFSHPQDRVKGVNKMQTAGWKIQNVTINSTFVNANLIILSILIYENVQQVIITLFKA